MRLITTEAEMLAHVVDEDPAPALVVAVDLRGIEESVTAVTLDGLCFLGCLSTEAFPSIAAERGAAILPSFAGPPVNTFPTRLYRVRDLYAGFEPNLPGSWRSTLDHRAFQWFMEPGTTRPRTLPQGEFWAARTHDTFIEAALDRFLSTRGQRAVGVMGGHDVPRDAEVYRTVATVARSISREERVIVTGGGPGLMEAANLGAFLASSPDSALEEALEILRPASDFRSHEWLASAARVRSAILGSWDAEEASESFSLGIPTWLYGHEPPNMFASHSAKFFFNSLREDGLVTVADGGLLFAKGNAGTVQEIFQDATQNYYRGDAHPTPMVLMDRAYWNPDVSSAAPVGSHGDGADPRSKPLWPLLRQLGKEKDFESALALTDDPDVIVDLLTRGVQVEDGPSLAHYRVEPSRVEPLEN